METLTAGRFEYLSTRAQVHWTSPQYLLISQKEVSGRERRPFVSLRISSLGISKRIKNNGISFTRMLRRCRDNSNN
jgi:hypothetical protein